MAETTTPEVHYYTAPIHGYGNGYGGYGNCGNESSIIRQIADSTASLTSTTQAQSYAAIQATNAAAQSAQEIATETRSDVNRIAGDVLLAQSQTEARIGPAIERNGAETRAVSAQVAADIRRDVSDVRTDLHQTLEDRFSEVRAAVGTNHGLIMLETAKTQFEVIKAKCDLERHAAENLAAIQLEACKNQHELSKQMAECCCEIKSAVHGEGEKTRDTFQNDKIAELRDKLDCSRRDHDRERANSGIRIDIENILRNRVVPAPVVA